MLTKEQIMKRLEVVDCQALSEKTKLDRQKIYRFKTTGSATYETIAALSKYYENLDNAIQEKGD